MTICAEADGRSWQHCTRGIQGCICGFDNPHRVAHVLRMHNKFRRGEIEMDQAPSANAVGLAIDAAIAMLTSNAEAHREAACGRSGGAEC